MTYIVTRNSQGKWEAGQKNHFSKEQKKKAIWEGNSNIAAQKKADEMNKKLEVSK